MGTSTKAAVDCGTNTTRLLISDDAGHGLVRELRTARLGQGVDESGLLNSEAIDRTLSALREFRALMDQHGVVDFGAVATSAVRDADNGDDFIKPAQEILGGKVDTISGDEEARLSYRGAISGREPGLYAVVDIGGGSTELILGDQDDVTNTVSLDIGCVRLSEQLLDGGPYSAEQLDEVDGYLAALLDAIDWRTKVSDRRVVGVAGTITTLAAVEKQLDTYSYGAVHGFELQREPVHDCYVRLASKSIEELRTVPGVPKDRADVIVAGVAILNAVFKRFGLQSIEVSEHDILDGIVSVLPGPNRK